MQPDQDLLLMIGEIRSDVKKLLTLEKRVSRLEHGAWVAAGVAGTLAATVTTAIAKLFAG